MKHKFFLCVYFYSLHVSGSHVPIIRRIIASVRHLVYITLCRWSLVCRSTCSCIPDISIRRTPNQLHSLQQIPTQHDMLPQHLVYINELNREYVITLARNDETPWCDLKRSKNVGVILSVLKCFKWKLYRCICWLIIEVILRNARCNDEIHKFYCRQNNEQ